MGDKMNSIVQKIEKTCYDHPVAATAVYMVGCGILTVKLYKVFGKIVAKEVVKALL